MAKIVKILSQSYLPTQGRYPRITSEARTLLEEGHRVLIMGWDRKCEAPLEESCGGIEIRRVRVRSGEMRGPVQAFFLLAFWIKAFLRLMREDIDIVHCHNLDVMPLGFMIQLTRSCKLVYDAHEPNYYALWPKRWNFLLFFVNGLEFFLARRADAVIVANTFQVEKFLARGISSVKEIGNWPVSEIIVDAPHRKKGRGLVFGRIGTIYPDIGLEEALGAMREVVREYPDTRLFLAGRVVEAYRPEFERVLREMGPLVEYYGPYGAQEMKALYEKIDVSLLLYRRNDWFTNITPTKFYDTLANGVPVVMTDIGGLGAVIREKGCGIVVDENDMGSIVSAMNKFITDDRFRRGASKKGLALIKEELNWDRAATELKDIYAAF
ncbi:MAG: glycosyltransferase family 4 protein [Thermodesulfobacteriota bacterium]